MSFTGIDEEQAAGLDHTLLLPIREVQAALGDDRRDGNGVAMLLDPLPRGQPQPDNPQRPGVGDRLPPDRAVCFGRYGPPRT